jgi:hypothetical protein
MAAITTTDQTTLKPEMITRPYPPSWFDHFKQWVERLPGPYWLFYVVLGLALALCATLIHWADGTYAIGSFSIFDLLVGAQTSYFFGFPHYLDQMAGRALATIRPSLNLSRQEYAEWEYRLTTLPARLTWLATFAGVVFIVLVFLRPNAFQAFQAYNALTSGGAIILFAFLLLIQWGAVGVLVYHSIRQLRIVSRLYTDFTQVDLFNLRPLYSLSGLTWRTAVGWLLVAYVDFFALQPYGTNAVSSAVGPVVIMGTSVLAIVTFVVPLLGIHRRLQAEKENVQRENAHQMKLTLAELHHRLTTGETQDMVNLNNTLSSLVTEENELAKIPTWPWHPETRRWLGTAILLPLAIWLVQFILQRFPLK